MTSKKNAGSEFDPKHPHSSEPLEMIFAHMTHEVCSYLQVIQGNAELLYLNAEEDSIEAKASRAILEAGQRVSDLTRKIMEFTPKEETEFTPLCVHEVLSDLLEILRFSMKSIKIDARLSAEHSIIVGDGFQLHAALLALAINARDAMPAGGTLMFETSSNRVAMEQVVTNQVVISVSDTGTGISSVNLQRIFDPYFTTKGLGKGSGLGLADVSRIIRSHGGNIDVSSSPFMGTTFKISFPCFEAGRTPAASRPEKQLSF